MPACKLDRLDMEDPKELQEKPEADATNKNAHSAIHQARTFSLRRETGFASELRPRSASRAKLGREPATVSLEKRKSSKK